MNYIIFIAQIISNEKCKMSKKYLILIFLLLIPTVYSFQTSSENYQSNLTLISSGGQYITSNNYNTTIAISQTAIGRITSSLYKTFLGFFYTLIDTEAPNLIIYEPNETFTIALVPLEFYVNDRNLEACWYYIHPYNINHTISCENTTVDAILYGTYTLYLFANDSFGNVNSTSISFEVKNPIETGGAAGGGGFESYTPLTQDLICFNVEKFLKKYDFNYTEDELTELQTLIFQDTSLVLSLEYLDAYVKNADKYCNITFYKEEVTPEFLTVVEVNKTMPVTILEIRKSRIFQFLLPFVIVLVIVVIINFQYIRRMMDKSFLKKYIKKFGDVPKVDFKKWIK